MRLATKLALALTVSIFVVVGLHGAWSAKLAVERMEHDRARLLSDRANLLAAAVSETLRSEGEQSARKLLGSTAGEIEPGRVAWLAASGAAPQEFRGTAQDWARLLGGQGVGPFIDKSHRFVAVYRPLGDGATVAGVLGIESSAAAAEAESRAILINTATIALALAVVCCLVILVATHFLVAKPLAEVTTQLRRIATDDLSGRLTVRGTDQFGDLANDVNEMTVGLEIARRRLEDETRRRVAATAQLRHAGRLKVVGQLAASMAHELGTPLNVASGRAHMISSGFATGEVAVECAEIIERQCKRMTERIQGLLGFARRDPGDRTAIDLALLVEGTVTLLGHMMLRAGASSQIELAAGGPWRTHGNKHELEQVLANLVTNAIQAMPEGGTLRFAVGPLPPGTLPADDDDAPGVYLELQDNGEGMSEEVRKRIFMPFFTTKEASEGTGLGLAVCADIVREHGGRIEVSSEEGVGTTFRLLLPSATAVSARLRTEHDASPVAPDDDARPA